MSRSPSRRLPALLLSLLLSLLLLLAPVAASAEPTARLDVSTVVQFLLSLLSGDAGSGLDPSGASSSDAGPGLDPDGATTGDAGPGLDPSGSS